MQRSGLNSRTWLIAGKENIGMWQINVNQFREGMRKFYKLYAQHVPLPKSGENIKDCIDIVFLSSFNFFEILVLCPTIGCDISRQKLFKILFRFHFKKWGKIWSLIFTFSSLNCQPPTLNLTHQFCIPKESRITKQMKKIIANLQIIKFQQIKPKSEDALF